jgi:peptidoglycan/LPS O-acetylase OafA/YrhL
MVDALRGLAALTIVVYHVIELIKWEDFPLSGPAVSFRAGWMAVDLFFVISGFVITISVKRCYDGASSTKEFWKVYFLKRFLRIAPLHFLTCGAFLLFINPAMLLSSTSSITWHISTHLFFIHNWFPETCSSINGANWSLGVEMQFYLLMALMASTFTKYRPSIFLVLSIVMSWAWRSSVFKLFEGQTWNGVNLVALHKSSARDA